MNYASTSLAENKAQYKSHLANGGKRVMRTSRTLFNNDEEDPARISEEGASARVTSNQFVSSQHQAMPSAGYSSMQHTARSKEEQKAIVTTRRMNSN